MKKVFIIHGFEGSPNGGWRPWLMAELEKKDVYACALPMPEPASPKLTEWIDMIKQIVKNPNRDIFLVGHSLGGPAILHYLETLRSDEKLGGCILVSSPEDANDSEHAKQLGNFFPKPFGYEKIKGNCNKFLVIHGDDDPVVPIYHAENIAKSLNCELVKVKNGKHLNGSAGWFSLPECLNGLIKMMD